MAPQLSPRSTFAGCEIEGVAGGAGMGIVYTATQTALGRRVALKPISAHLATDSSFRERFKREWLTAASIDHPNVIPLYEAGEAEAHPFIVMRYVDGVDFAALIARSLALDPERAAGIVLTKASDSQSALTRTGMFVGSLDYSAPEQIRGETADARADVYSLGCVLYQAVAGAVPFDRDSDVAKLYAQLNHKPPSLLAARPDAPPALEAVVVRAMAKEPANRSQTAGEGFVRVANKNDDTVTRIDPVSSKVAGAAMPVGSRPTGIAVGGGSVWVADHGDGTVTQLDP